MSLHETLLSNLEALLKSKNHKTQEILQKKYRCWDSATLFNCTINETTNFFFQYSSCVFSDLEKKQSSSIFLDFNKTTKIQLENNNDFKDTKSWKKSSQEVLKTLIKRLIRILKCEIQSQKRFERPLKILLIKSLKTQNSDLFENFIKFYNPEKRILLCSHKKKDENFFLDVFSLSNIAKNSAQYYQIPNINPNLKRLFRNYGYQEKGFFYFCEQNQKKTLHIIKNRHYKEIEITPLYKNFHDLGELLHDIQKDCTLKFPKS